MRTLRLLLLAGFGIACINLIAPVSETLRAWREKLLSPPPSATPPEEQDFSLSPPKYVCGNASAAVIRKAGRVCRKDADCKLTWWLSEIPGGYLGEPRAYQVQTALDHATRAGVRLSCVGDCVPAISDAVDRACVDELCEVTWERGQVQNR